jgi:L-fuculose-phosphate aldolase
MSGTAIPWTEREVRRQIVKACEALSRRGLVAATDGNVSARLGPDRILISPSGTAKGEVTERNILLCDGAGRLVRGDPTGRYKPSVEIQLHLAAYREREDISGVVHAHPPVASAFTFAGKEDLLKMPVVPEVVAQIGAIPTAPFLTPGSPALAETAAPHFRQSDVVMLARHGAVALGRDPWQAFLRLEKLEHAATIIKCSCELAGSEQGIKRLSPEEIESLVRDYGRGRANQRPNAGSEEDETQLVEAVTREVLRRLQAK